MQVSGSRYCWRSAAILSITYFPDLDESKQGNELKHVNDLCHAPPRLFRKQTFKIVALNDRLRPIAVVRRTAGMVTNVRYPLTAIPG